MSLIYIIQILWILFVVELYYLLNIFSSYLTKSFFWAYGFLYFGWLFFLIYPIVQISSFIYFLVSSFDSFGIFAFFSTSFASLVYFSLFICLYICSFLGKYYSILVLYLILSLKMIFLFLHNLRFLFRSYPLVFLLFHAKFPHVFRCFEALLKVFFPSFYVLCYTVTVSIFYILPFLFFSIPEFSFSFWLSLKFSVILCPNFSTSFRSFLYFASLVLLLYLGNFLISLSFFLFSCLRKRKI